MQQYLPFTVLKLPVAASPSQIRGVATVLTVYGIETATLIVSFTLTLDFFVATVLTVYGIETFCKFFHDDISFSLQQYLPFTVLKLYSLMTSHTDFFNVATVLTVYGIETFQKPVFQFIAWELQQYLPFTVLKLSYHRL